MINLSEYKTKIRIVEPKDVRKVAQRVINQLMQDGEMDNAKARTISSLLNTSLKAMEQGELQEKLDKIEERLEQGGQW